MLLCKMAVERLLIFMSRPYPFIFLLFTVAIMSSNKSVSYLMVSRTALFVMQSTWEMPGVVLWYFISNAWIRRSNSSVCVQD